MNDFVLALILGVVEGVTEFLPVSSTAHLRLAQHFLGLSLEDEFWKLFAVFIQIGAIAAVVVLYRRRLVSFTGEACRLLSPPQPFKLLAHPVSLISAAFLCTAIPAFLLKRVIGQNLESLSVMVAALFMGGLVMIIVDRLFAQGRTQRLEDMKLWQAVWVGLVQVLSAVFPGTSRSMSTIAGAQLAGLSRSAALDFSFLLSIPVMVVATLYDLYKYKKEVGVSLDPHQSQVLAVGTLVSFVVAYAVVAWFLGYVKKHGFLAFGIYRIAAAAALFFFLR